MDEDALDLAVPLVLDRDGWSLYLRDPHSGECLLIGFESKREAAEAKRLAVRRTLSHLIAEISCVSPSKVPAKS